MTADQTDLGVLISRIEQGEPLSADDRAHAARLLRVAEQLPGLLRACQNFGASGTLLSGYAPGSSAEQGDPPITAVLILDRPDPDTWAYVQGTFE